MADLPTDQRKGLENAQRELNIIRWLLTILGVLAICAALHFGRGFALPIMLSVIMALVLRPVTRWLNRLGLPHALSAGLVVITVFGSLLTLLYFAAGPAGKWVEDAPQMGRDLQYKLSNLFESAEALGDMGKQVEKISEGPKDIGVQEVVVRSPGLVSRAATGAREALASIVLSFFLLYFMLAQRPYLIRRLAGLDRRLLLLRVPLLRGWDQGGVHDLAGHGNVALLLQLPIEGLHHALQRPGLGQFVAEQTDRVLIRRRTAQIEAQEAHPRQPIPNHELHARVGEIMLRLQDQALNIDTGSNGGRPPLVPFP